MYGKYKTNLYCLNCGKMGHIQSRCLYPINSWGLICIAGQYKFNDIFKMSSNYIGMSPDIDTLSSYLKENLKILLVQRKNSLCYVEFIRGRYYYDNLQYICNMISNMSTDEQNMLLTKDFETLWCEMWNISDISGCHLSEYNTSKTKFTKLKTGIICHFNKKLPVFIRLETIISMNKSKYLTPEWGLPKGRKNQNETELKCAIREFEEETNIERSKYTLLIDDNQFVEKYVGSDGVTYRNNYFLAELKDENTDIKLENTELQMNEIGDIRWVTYNDAMELIRDYNVAKKHILQNIIYMLTNVILKTNSYSKFIKS